ncbi:MAG: response regulator [Bacteroidetes bacterium]|nr:MAG: response regulator [Bacteroidota bacterium]
MVYCSICMMPKILVVDNDKDLLEMMEMSLSRLGYDITTLAKGSGFLSIIESIRPDIILLDIFLGDADGRNLCYQMKLHPAYQNIPVILYSAGHISFSTIQKSKADEFIVKPFEIDQLLGKIKELLVI